ncbi:hypothetical protein JOS77_15235 [Chromobacterium haemolyticum]|nr:hypothetical protein JOS77_15235 [Chromobacterium haemolyticum]
MPQPTRFKNPQAEDSQFQLRLIVAYALIVLMFLVLLTRFIWLQVLQHEHFSTLAQNNRISLVPILPNRGLIPGPQRRGAGAELLRLHAGADAQQDTGPGRHRGRAAQARGDHPA